MKIAIAGGSGLIGRAIKAQAEEAGHEVVSLRIPRPPKSQAHQPEAWDKALAAWSPQHFSDYDAVMFFGGEPIASRWTSKKLQRIQLSRQKPSRRIAECCAAAAQPPRVIVSASAIGYYGEHGEELITEDSPAGTGVLPPTTSAWEASWNPAREAGIRVVTLRLGVVLSPEGGALKVMLPAFKAGLGGNMGSGDQWMAWISLADAARLALWCAETESITGPINATSPEPVRQQEFAHALGAALKRPAIVPAPRAALKIAFGRMADETVLLSCRAVPSRASEAGFHFNDFEIAATLRRILK